MENRQKIRAFVKEQLLEHGFSEDVKDDESLILSGLLDSLSVVHMVVFMENEFGIDFSDIYFDQNDFDSVDDMMAFIEKHRP